MQDASPGLSIAPSEQPTAAPVSPPAVAIELEGVSKLYRMYQRPLDRLREALHPFRKTYHANFAALNNVSLQVFRGESVGVLGRNGSGKSTLLKVITGVTAASSGSVRVHGRISAMLELGTGFNPQLTGRENVYFSGLLMGYSHEQMQERFDDIAAFADIGEFIDQPTRSYSSGMQARLGFAVAASVEPDILIVDEALAVGDEAFQRKCFARIRNIQESGATVLFVTHGAATVIDLCSRAVLIDRGEVLLSGSPKYVVSRYHKLLYAPHNQLDKLREEIRQQARGDVSDTPVSDESLKVQWNLEQKRDEETAYYDPNLRPQSTVEWPVRGARILDPHLETLDGRRVNVLQRGQEYELTYRVEFLEAASHVGFGMMLKTITGYELAGAVTVNQDRVDFVPAGAMAQVRVRFTARVTPGAYFFNAGVISMQDGKEVYLHRILDAAMVLVRASGSSAATGIVDLQVQPSVDVFQAA